MPRHDSTIRLTFTVEIPDGPGSTPILEDIAAVAQRAAVNVLNENGRREGKLDHKITVVNPLHEKLEPIFQNIRNLAQQ